MHSTCPFRYYAGDQEELFREAHLVHPQRRRPQPNPPNLKVNSSPRLHTHTITVLILQAQLTATCGAAASPGQEYICDVCMMSYPLSVSTTHEQPTWLNHCRKPGASFLDWCKFLASDQLLETLLLSGECVTVCVCVCVCVSAGDEWPGVWALVLPAVLELVSLCHDNV